MLATAPTNEQPTRVARAPKLAAVRSADGPVRLDGDAARDAGPQLDPDVWGPPLWDMLFCLAIKAPASCAVDVQIICQQLEKVIPCQHCRRSYTVYRRMLKPINSMRDIDPVRPAAPWLWTIHDLVNQDLGKICISYDKLLKRHRATASITHDLNVLNLLSMMALAVRPHHLIAFAETLCRVLSKMEGFLLPGVLRPEVLKEDTLLDQLFECDVQLRGAKHMLPLSREAFDEQLAAALAT